MDEVYSPHDQLKSWSAVWKVPNYIAADITQIDYDKLVSEGVQHLVFDVDNTLVSFGEPTLSAARQIFLLHLMARPGIRSVRLASNSPRNLDHFREALGVPVLQPRWWSFKPMPSFYRRILRQVKAPAQSVAMIGDKLIQDVWGGNAVGMVTVLVRPLGRDNMIDVIIRTRPREKRLLRRYLPRHIQRWF